ncbi:hypothetical protein HPB47_012372 [Ixodes persulcatus]|uniref:Uncharacterized protein n=1 Tax=Ixodes persulcatus TaxID=34615 RepID=A0AC60NTW2_IXOPE|nr:hypothetical protein HPB47_012372 [Ixodes persulcatus]
MASHFTTTDCPATRTAAIGAAEFRSPRCERLRGLLDDAPERQLAGVWRTRLSRRERRSLAGRPVALPRPPPTGKPTPISPVARSKSRHPRKADPETARIIERPTLASKSSRR